MIGRLVPLAGLALIVSQCISLDGLQGGGPSDGGPETEPSSDSSWEGATPGDSTAGAETAPDRADEPAYPGDDGDDGEAGADSGEGTAPTLSDAAAEASPDAPDAAPQRTEDHAVGVAAWGLEVPYEDPPVDAKTLVESGIRVVLMQLSWATLEPVANTLEPVEIEKVAARLQDYRDNTNNRLQVVLDFGLQQAPGWFLEKNGARFVQQDGTPNDGREPNLVWDKNLQSFAETYIKDVVGTLLDRLKPVSVVRVGAGPGGALGYPFHETEGIVRSDYWAFDDLAQSEAPVEVDGWRPGQPSPNGEAQAFVGWYLDSLSDYQNWQVATVRTAWTEAHLTSTLPTVAIAYPTIGLVGGQLDEAVASNLNGSSDAEQTGLVQRGCDHARHIAALAPLARTGAVAVYSTSAETAGVLGRLGALADGYGSLPLLGQNSGKNTWREMRTAVDSACGNGLLDFIWSDAVDAYSPDAGLATIENYKNYIAQCTSGVSE